MYKLTTQLDQITNTLKENVELHVLKANEAMEALELMNITPEKYREASESLAHHTVANACLSRVLNVVATGDIKKVESIMRFYCYQINRNRANCGVDGIVQAYKDVNIVLGGIISAWFED